MAIAEERFWGGTCVNVGCVPKKIMVNAAEYGSWLEEAREFGWDVSGVRPVFNLATLKKARDAEVGRLNGIYKKMLEGNGCTVFDARAVFVDPHTLDVGGQRVTAEKIIIATGGSALRPEFPGAELGMLSDDVFDMDKVPKRLVCVGSGYISLEFACAFKGFGSQVETLYRADLPLRGFDQDVRVAVKEALTAQGIKQNCSPSIKSLTRNPTTNTLNLNLATGTTLETDAVLFAVGRVPNTSSLNLSAARITPDSSGAIPVDSEHRTSQPHIYAIGDVTDKLNLTPMATAVGHALADTLFGKNPRKASYLNVPSAVFTSPPVGTVGLTEEEASKLGPVDVYVTSFNPMRHTISKREGKRTMMKLVVDQRTRKVVGAHMVGEEAGEIMQVRRAWLSCAVGRKLTVGVLVLGYCDCGRRRPHKRTIRSNYRDSSGKFFERGRCSLGI